MTNPEPIFTLMTHGEICKALGERARAKRKQQKLSRWISKRRLVVNLRLPFAPPTIMNWWKPLNVFRHGKDWGQMVLLARQHVTG